MSGCETAEIGNERATDAFLGMSECETEVVDERATDASLGMSECETEVGDERATGAFLGMSECETDEIRGERKTNVMLVLSE